MQIAKQQLVGVVGLALTIFLVGAGCSSNSVGKNTNGASNGKNAAVDTATQIRGVGKQNGSMVVVKNNGEVSPLQSDFVTKNGTTVMTDGRIIMSDGAIVSIENGQMVMSDGTLVNNVLSIEKNNLE